MKVKDVYEENCETLIKEIGEDPNKWKAIPYSWIGRVSIIKNNHITQSSLHIQCNPCQNIHVIFNRNRENNSKICIELKK